MKRNKQKLKSKYGFTLIELLLAITILAILSSFILINLIDVQQRARDGQRKASIAQIQLVLEQFHTDNGFYPISINNNTQINNTPCTLSFLFNSITYLKQIPCDPLGASSNFNNGDYYYYSADGKSYTVAGCLERKSDPDGQAKLQ